MSNPSGNSGNKYFKQQPQQQQQQPQQSTNQYPGASQPGNSNDRLMWEMRNIRHHNYQYYRNRTPNTTPSSTVLNSPDLNDIDDFKLMEHYQNYNQQQLKSAGLADGTAAKTQNNLDSQSSYTKYPNPNIDTSDPQMNSFEELDEPSASWMPQQQPANSISLLALSPTSSHSSTNSSTQAPTTSNENTRNRVIGGLHIADLQGSPRRFGNQSMHSPTESIQPSSGLAVKPLGPSSGKKSVSPNNCPKRPPGFPKRIITPKEIGNPEPEKLIDDNDDEDKTPLEHPPFDYLYEFSETRKVLEEFFTPQQQQQLQQEKLLQFQQQTKRQQAQQMLPLDADFDDPQSSAYIEQRLAALKQQQRQYEHQLQQQYENQNVFKNREKETGLYDSGENSRSSCCDEEENVNASSNNLNNSNKKTQAYFDLEAQSYYMNNIQQSKNFTLSPETTDYDSNCGDLDSELSLKYDFSLTSDVNGVPDMGRLYTGMPVLEDGLSSGHASDTENNNPNINLPLDSDSMKSQPISKVPIGISSIQTSLYGNYNEAKSTSEDTINVPLADDDLDNNHSQIQITQLSETSAQSNADKIDVQSALKDIRATLQRTKTLTNNINDAIVGVEIGVNPPTESDTHSESSAVNKEVEATPVWVPRNNNNLTSQKNMNNSKESLNSSAIGDNQIKLVSGDEEEADTDLETDRLLGQQRLEEQQGFDDNKNLRKIRCANGQIIRSPAVKTHTSLRHGVGTQPLSSPVLDESEETKTDDNDNESRFLNQKTSPTTVFTKTKSPTSSTNSKGKEFKRVRGSRNKEGMLDPAVLIEGVLFKAHYLGSTQLVCEGQPTKSTRMMQAEEAVSRIKAPEGENQPSTEVDLFISTEKIMVLNTDLKEIMMDHALRTISYIADIGDLIVLMARRRFVAPSSQDSDIAESGGNDTTPPKSTSKGNRTPKMICHVFESEEAQFIAQSIGQAFQVAYMEFLKANGIEDHSFMKEMDYQEVLNSQEIFGDELEVFAKKELQKEVVVPKMKGEILGVVIVESGWGSMVPTVVIANLAASGAAARCGQLNIGDQIIAINGLSLVGLPLSQCQTYIKNTKNQTAVKFTVVPCAPVVEVKIKRPNTKYQLGFSVQNGVICSLLRGGIAERGGVRVGHRIIEINNQSVVAVPHEKIVNLLATSVGEIHMKTMPTSMFRLLTGQENPIYI